MTQLKRIGGPLMKKLVCFAVIFLGLSIMAMAQDFPRGEVFLGYSHLACNNPSYIFGFGVGGKKPGNNCSYNGWDLSVAINANKLASFVADVGGTYNASNPPRGLQDHYHVYTFLFGPRLSLRKFNKVTPFVQGLVGIARVTPGLLGWPYENDFAVALGAGVDIKVYKNFSFRPVQLDYLGIKSGKPLTDNIRYNAGFTYSFGSVTK
jgi:hypothetical protein